MALATVLAAACGSDGGESGTPDTVSTTAALADVDEVAAARFIEAWEGDDTATMRRLGHPEAVSVAFIVGRAEGSGDCSTQPNGQYQCIVAVSTGTRMYLLVGEPGAPEGQVWWVAEYVPGT